MAYGLLGDNSVQDKDYAGGYQDADGAAGRHGTGSQAVIIFISFHLRQGHRAHSSRRGQGRAADGSEAGTGTNSSHGQAAAKMPQPGMDGVIEVLT